VSADRPGYRPAGHGGPRKGVGRGGGARGYSWEPFQPGNMAAVRHGAMSPRVYLSVARELAAGALAARPDLEPFAALVAEWAENQARADLVRVWLADRELLDDDGIAPGVGGALKLMHACERRAAEAARALGLDPASEARLAAARSTATLMQVDLAAVAAAGRAALQARAGDEVEVVAVERDADDEPSGDEATGVASEREGEGAGR
jgi:hypothetical protein